MSETQPREYVVRFVLGGLLTAAAGLITIQWGPVVGGLFLAFPSIVPASLTLVARHSRLTAAAGATALGAALGMPGWVVLTLAGLVWVVIAVTTWAAFEIWRRRHKLAARLASTHVVGS